MEQDTFLTQIPSELLNVICLHLDYTEISIIIKHFSVDVNYQYLLSNKYPAFYEIVNHIRKHSLEYKDYSYARGYDLMSLAEIQLRDEIINIKYNNIRADNKKEFINVIYNNQLTIRELMDIIGLDELLSDAEYNKYREYFPNIENSNEDFLIASYDYSNTGPRIDVYINAFNIPINRVQNNRLNSLYCIFLYVLDNKINVSIKEKIQNLKFKNNLVSRAEYIKERIMYLYIINYINNTLKL